MGTDNRFSRKPTSFPPKGKSCFIHTHPHLSSKQYFFRVHHHQPCHPAEAHSWMNGASKRYQSFPAALSITASLPMSTMVNPSPWCAVHLPQHSHGVFHLVLKFSRVAWLHFTCFCFPLLVIEGICYGPVL